MNCAEVTTHAEQDQPAFPESVACANLSLMGLAPHLSAGKACCHSDMGLTLIYSHRLKPDPQDRRTERQTSHHSNV
jgi:hypothetical protein